MMSLRIATILAVADVARSQFPCTGTLKNKGSTALCSGDSSSTCGAGQCCTTDSNVKTCKDVAGLVYVTGIAKCQANAAASFFDLKKLSAVVASDSEADVKRTCCTATSEAKCSDWLNTCPSGNTKVGTNSAPADTGTPKLTISTDSFKSKCCVKTCKDIAGFLYVSGIAKCQAKAAASFFDLKKLSAVVASDSEDDVKSACCTATSDAKCSDWLNTCPSGHTKVGTNSAPADTGTPKLTISADSFKGKCCVQTCKDVGGVLYATGNTKCRANSAALFFDTKKLSAVVSSDSEADVKSACCTATSEAKCSDWLNVCPNGKFKVSSNTASANSGNPKLTITADGFTSKCCVSPMKCSDYSEDTSGAFSKATSLAIAVAVAAFSGMM